jgi:hypothetical protein
MRILPLVLLIISLPVVLNSCKKSQPPQFHYEYFGLEPGRYIIYNVSEITHNKDLGIHDTLNYQLKTLWGDTIMDNEGRIAREFLRYTRTNSGEPWVLQDVWSGLIDGIRAELIEENQRTVKLVFAPTLSKSWDANAYNMFDPLDCYYRDIHIDTLISGVNLDSTLVVEQEDYTSLIDTVRKYEVYAKHIGLVRKYFRDNAYQFGSAEVVLGRELFYDFIQTGIE